MAVDHIRYDILAQDALRGVVRTVLTDAAKNGLPGEHHFYISFDTTRRGRAAVAALRAQYPEEMTIVLQHQFWDLMVTEEAFEVGLSFGGVPERLAVPFDGDQGFLRSVGAVRPAIRDDRRSRGRGAGKPRRSRRREDAAPSRRGRRQSTVPRRRAARRRADAAPEPPSRRRAGPTSRAAAKWCGSTASARNRRRSR